MSDLMVAASYVDVVPQSSSSGYAPRRGAKGQDDFFCVDDFEIAAAAAESCAPKDESHCSMREDEESESIDRCSEVSEGGSSKLGMDEELSETVKLYLSVGSTGVVSLTVELENDGGNMDAAEVTSQKEGAKVTSLSDDSDEEDMHQHHEEMKRQMEEMIVKAPEAVANVQLELPKLEAMDPIYIDAMDKLDPVGSIMSVVDGTAVVKALELSRPLEIGSVLATGSRIAVGRVQDIFGPVISPFYVVELCGGMNSIDSMKPNLAVFSVAKHAKYIIPHELEQTVSLDDVYVDCDDEPSDKEEPQGKSVPPLVGGHAFLRDRRMKRAKRSSQAKTTPRDDACIIQNASRTPLQEYGASTDQVSERNTKKMKVYPPSGAVEGPDDPPPPRQIPMYPLPSPNISHIGANIQAGRMSQWPERPYQLQGSRNHTNGALHTPAWTFPAMNPFPGPNGSIQLPSAAIPHGQQNVYYQQPLMYLPICNQVRPPPPPPPPAPKAQQTSQNGWMGCRDDLPPGLQ